EIGPSARLAALPTCPQTTEYEGIPAPCQTNAGTDLLSVEFPDRDARPRAAQDERGEGGAGGEVGLAVDRGQVRLDRAAADVQPAGDGLVAQAQRDELGDLPLPGGQMLQPGRSLRRCGWRLDRHLVGRRVRDHVAGPVHVPSRLAL